MNHCLSDIAHAFKYDQPADVSYHRVNFARGKDSENGELGLKALRSLLQGIDNTWPDVEFISFREFAERYD